MTSNEVMTNLERARRLRQILWALVLVLTFEGLARKASPDFLRVPIFFLKDVLVLGLGWYVLRMPLSSHMRPIWNAYIALIVLIQPSVIATAWHDPLLAVFGMKQYLLYPLVGFAVFLAFEKSNMEITLNFYRRIALLVAPTALLAFVQSHLPSNNWLNMSVNGQSLEGFSAAGHLRVSSTFSFVAQYCAFLNAQAFIVVIALQGWSQRGVLWKIYGACLLPMIVFSCFITGSRGAVVGNISIILMASAMAFLKFRMKNIYQVGFLMGALYIMVLTVNYIVPSATAAYSERERGNLVGVSTDIQTRVMGSFYDTFRDRSMTTFMGNGLGVMSNGSDTFSNYAASWRERIWSESDFPTTLFEGGYYLVIVWYGFRLFVIFTTTRYFISKVTPEYSTSMGFCQSFVIIIGILGTLALQPPIAIWWWLGVGTSMLFSWKSVASPDTEIEEGPPPPPQRKIRGRSLYAEAIHGRK